MTQAYEELETVIQKKFCPDFNVVSCSSGTAALHLALESLSCKQPARWCVTGDYNMAAVPRAICLAGYKPWFVDCDLNNLLINLTDEPTGLLQELSSLRYDFRPKAYTTPHALVVTHLYGRRADMEMVHSIVDIANKEYEWSMHVIEDMAQLHGVPPHHKTSAACWSFYKNKVIFGEEGGAVAFSPREEDARQKCIRLKNLGMEPGRGDYTHIPRGHNYRLANCLAEKILVSFDRADVLYHQRKQVESMYDNYIPPNFVRWQTRVSPWVYDVQIPGTAEKPSQLDKTVIQKKIVDRLQVEGIEARYGFKSMTTLPEWAGSQSIGTNAMRASCETVYFPMNAGLSEKVVKRCTEVLLEETR